MMKDGIQGEEVVHSHHFVKVTEIPSVLQSNKKDLRRVPDPLRPVG
jgi:hypothetical protein